MDEVSEGAAWLARLEESIALAARVEAIADLERVTEEDVQEAFAKIRAALDSLLLVVPGGGG